jgi:hypothetical protein
MAMIKMILSSSSWLEALKWYPFQDAEFLSNINLPINQSKFCFNFPNSGATLLYYLAECSLWSVFSKEVCSIYNYGTYCNKILLKVVMAFWH